MIPPEVVADLAVSLCTEGEVFTLPRLPAGTRLYRSFYDSLGVSYASLKAGLRFIDLVGQAYRGAGAGLLGLTCPTGQIPCLPLGEDDRRNLERLAAALNNGGGLGMASPLLAEALIPLQAFREEMRRQQLIGRDRDEAETCLASVVKGLRTGLEELGAG